MSNRVDSTGTFIGTIVEHSLGSTKNGFPQFIVRVKAEKKFISDTDGLAHFKLAEPAYVDWSSFDEEQLGYLVLFNAEKALLSYERLQIATGWDGTEFDSLNNGSLVGKEILFRVEENTYEGKTNLQINWLDKPDAAPTRTLQALDPAKVKDLASKFLAGTAKPKAVVAAKPVSKPGKPAAPAPVATAPSAPASATTPATAPKSRGKKVEEVAEEPEVPVNGLPAEVTQDLAWATVVGRKGTTDDTAVQDAWIAAVNEIAGERDEDDLTVSDWAAVRDHVLKSLKL